MYRTTATCKSRSYCNRTVEHRTPCISDYFSKRGADCNCMEHARSRAICSTITLSRAHCRAREGEPAIAHAGQVGAIKLEVDAGFPDQDL